VLRNVLEVDRQPAAVAALRRVRRLLPGDAGFGDPLSVSGRDSAAVVARVADRLFDEQPRATREVGLGALQVWQSALAGVARRRGEPMRTVLFTDLVGFSSWALQAGDDDTLALLRRVASALEPPVGAHGGQVVKRLGDGLMAVFPGPQAAFQAVQDGQQRLAGVERAGYRPALKAGLHTGRPRAIGSDYLGVDVNVAARLAERAAAGELLVSDTALAGLDPERVDVRRKRTLPWARAKGVPEDLTVYVATPRAQPTEL